MTDKEKIRAEIERLKRWNDNVRESTRHMTVQEEDYNRGKNSSYLELLEFINSLPEEPVSEDLKKAANTYMNKEIDNGADYVDQDGDYYFYATGLEYAFKAGAKWQKQQMMAKAVDVTIAIPYQNGYGGYTHLVDSQEALPFGENIKVLVIKED